jgi:anti-sigma regulatory factor (Ser/Thr protein kinase)
MNSAHTIAELKIPADPSYILAAKRTSEAVGTVLGFGVEDLDDLKIAVAQACESTMEACRQNWGIGCGQIRLTFRSSQRGLQVDVQACGGPRAQLEFHDSSRDELAMNLLSCFVDELRYSTNHGALRLRMVKRRLA